MFRRREFPAAVKFQYRDLDNHRHGDDAYAKKFRDSRLTANEEYRLVQVAREEGLLVGATCFDPSSCHKLAGLDFAKIASCSATDWETIRTIEASGLPVIASTGGLTIRETDQLAFVAPGRLALMHCVSRYPCPQERCDLARIRMLRGRYGTPVGWSTHEDPHATLPIQIATAYGADIFERHIGLGGENGYTSSPEQIERWISAWYEALTVIGQENRNDREDERKALARVERKIAA